jgi:electron transfer flavoprotein beta subunit
MEIIVLLKQVPSTEALVEVDESGKAIKTEDINWVISPYDEFAVEEALRIKEAQGGTVTIVTVGLDKAQEAMRTAMAMGADKGVLINDPAAVGRDGLATAKVLSAVVKTMTYDVIVAGQRAVDGEGYQVATAVAELLEIPSVTLVIKQEVIDGKIRCTRTVEGGTVTIEAPLPALFTTQRGLNEPRYASLPGVMKAKKKPLEVKNLADIDLDAAALDTAKAEVVALSSPPKRKAGRMIEGETAQAKAEALVKALHEEAKVI